MYNIFFTDKAKKQLKKLDKETNRRINLAIKKIRIRPYSFIKKLVNLPIFTLRVGNYRILLNIIEDKLIILILEVGHRRNIYK